MKNDKSPLDMTANICECGSNIKRTVGNVTPTERDEIRFLFERKNGLFELFRTFSGMSAEELDNTPLYNKVVKDMGEVSTRFQKWWEEKSRQYNWENIPGWKWEIDFDTCTIYIVKQ